MFRLLIALPIVALGAHTTFAADQAQPAPATSANGFDFAFGVKVQSDYISRGITQSGHDPSVTGYGELRYNWGDTQLYAGVQPWSVRLPTDPLAEIDLYGGVRQTWGKFAIDVGAIEYWYPNNDRQYWTNGAAGIPGGFTVLNPVGASALTCAGLASVPPPAGLSGLCATTAKNPSFLELYVKPSYNITDALSLGLNVYWSPNWDNYHFQSLYASLTPKYTFGDSGFSLSGEIGRQWLGSLRPGTIFNAGPTSFKYPDYWSWNLGLSYAWKNATFDLRYYGSNLSKSNCYIVSSDPGATPVGPFFRGTSNWCDQRIVASISFDFTALKDLKW